jgi:PIN domain nuclease of toxin-antitoxin system
MRLLLDTHIYLWVLSDSRRLKADARRRIEAADAVHVSAVSIWETAIKSALGKVEGDPAEMAASIAGCGFVELPVMARHGAQVALLPLHHHDPFDRLLVAQAQSERLHLLTVDSALEAYGESVIRV